MKSFGTSRSLLLASDKNYLVYIPANPIQALNALLSNSVTDAKVIAPKGSGITCYRPHDNAGRNKTTYKYMTMGRKTLLLFTKTDNCFFGLVSDTEELAVLCVYYMYDQRYLDNLIKVYRVKILLK